MHGWGAATYNWNCGSEFYDTSGCDGESEYAVNNMPDTVEMIYSDIGDEVRQCSGVDLFNEPLRSFAQCLLLGPSPCLRAY